MDLKPTNQEMIQALKTVRDFCSKYCSCEYCPIQYPCHEILKMRSLFSFADELSCIIEISDSEVRRLE